MIITSTNGAGVLCRLVSTETGEPINKGDKVKGFRDVTYRIDGGRAPTHEGSTGKVWTDKGEFFPAVVNAKWAPVA